MLSKTLRKPSHTVSTFGLSLLLFANCATPPTPTPPRKPTPTPAPTPPPPPIGPAAWNDFSGALDDTGVDSLVEAATSSLAWLDKQPAQTNFKYGDRIVSLAAMQHGYRTLIDVAKRSNGNLETMLPELKQQFVLMKAAGGGDGKLMATGYYVPALDGSLTKQDGYEIPIYKTPPDMLIANLEDFGVTGTAAKRIRGRVEGNRFVPFYTRAEIRAQSPFANKGLEIAWAKKEVDLFVAEIQGTAVLNLPDGTTQTINYENSNGYTYKAIGKLLKDEGKIPPEKLSMQTILQYLAENPGEVRRVLDYNPSFVFFHFISGGAEGAYSFNITAGRSAALDTAIFPPMAIGFLDVEKPGLDENGNLASNGRLSRFVFNHDTGGAIKGPGRLDLFWGFGKEAESLAGIMQSKGDLFLLVPREETTPAGP